jgi:hypothetical protein
LFAGFRFGRRVTDVNEYRVRNIMKQTILSHLPAAGLCVLLALGQTAAMAAEPNPVPLPPGYGPTKGNDPWQRRVNEVRLDGIPYSEVATVLAKSFPEINFVVTPGEIEQAVSLNLRSVTLDDIFAAMNLATRGCVQAAKINDRMVNIKVVEAVASEPTPKKVCRAFSLSRYLSGRADDQRELALKELEDALDQCWMMLQKANPTDPTLQRPELSLHSTTKLLIVVGVPEQLAVVEEVVNQLEGGPPPAIDPTTGLPIAPGAGGYGGGGRVGGGRSAAPVPDPAVMEAFRRRYGIDMQTGQPAPASPPSTNRPGSSK